MLNSSSIVQNYNKQIFIPKEYSINNITLKLAPQAKKIVKVRNGFKIQFWHHILENFHLRRVSFMILKTRSTRSDASFLEKPASL